MYLICLAIGIYVGILYARIILSFVYLFKPGWVPPSELRPILDLIYAATDPPVNALRKIIPQPFGFPIDLAFLVWFLFVIIVHGQLCPGAFL